MTASLRLLLVLSLLLAGCVKAPAVIDPDRLATEIHRLTNALRSEQGVGVLGPLPELDGLSLRHSQNMADKNFFEHDDPDGNTPADRLDQFLPALLSASSGENIAVRSLGGEDETALAETLIQMWRESPGHYRNMLSTDFRHLGIGVVKTDDRVYATQTFAAGIALLSSELPLKVTSGQALTLEFRYLGDFPSSELTAFMHAPDANARIPAGNGSFFIGKGPVKIDWIDETHFRIRIATDYGLGIYRLALGRGKSYYTKNFSFEVVSPTI